MARAQPAMRGKHLPTMTYLLPEQFAFVQARADAEYTSMAFEIRKLVADAMKEERDA